MTRFLALVLFLPALCRAQPAPKSTAAPTLNRLDVQKMADRVLKETSAIRGLSIQRGVPTNVMSRAQIEKMMGGEIARPAVQTELNASQLYLRQVGLAPKNYDLRAGYTRLMGEQIAGFYSAQTRSFTTSDRVAPLELETVMAHELTHALQDQHFDLGRLDKWPRHESDSKLAFTSLVEGDATLVMSRYMTANPLRFFGVFMSSLGSLSKSNSAVLGQSPRSLRESLLFPYQSGLAFVTRIQTGGGWDAVSEAFNRPPLSTQQILHPGLYLENKAPEHIDLPDVRRALGSEWTLLDNDVNGEFGLSLVAGENGDISEANAAAANWAGDRYAIFGGPKGAVLVVQDSSWNNESGAKRWRAAYAHRTNLRFGSKAKEQTRGVLSVWNAAPDGTWLWQRGRRVVMLEGTVGAFNVERVMAILEKRPAH